MVANQINSNTGDKSYNSHPALEWTLLTFLLIVSLYIFKLPLRHIPIAFYDDGEILYHAFNLSKGGIPYLNDMSHHFLGYALPIYLWGEIAGYGAYTTREFFYINQIFCGFGVFLIARHFLTFGWAVIGALLYVSSREPFVTGLLLQYQFNLLFIFLLYSTLCLTKTNENKYLYLSFFLSGLLFFFDQRALLYSAIPLYVLAKKIVANGIRYELRGALTGLLIWASIPLITLLYLYSNNALTPFIEQTFTYPALYRIGSFSLWQIIYEGINLHKYLFTLTPYLVVLSALGYLVLLLDKDVKNCVPTTFREILYLLPPVLFLISASGGRDFDYYTIVWLPYLAILATLLALYIRKTSKVMQLSFAFLYLFALAPPFYKSIAISKTPPFNDHNYTDGANETVQFLNANLTENDTVFMWGYRLDIMVRIDKLFHYPFSSQIMIHPDKKIIGKDRDSHIYYPYQKMFFDLIKTDLPTYMIRFSRADYEEGDSPSKRLVEETIATKYKMVFEIEKEDFLKGRPKFEVYKLNTAIN